ncbi:MAG: response regulator [Asgard group archaeon]|nr:response regulator [Asgard group archaeon]
MGCLVKIVIIDDNELVRNLLKELLKREGHTPFIFETAEKALDIINQIQPDIAIVDIILPDKSGIELIKEIRAISPLTESIVITGYKTVEHMEQVLSTHAAYGFLEKPLDVDRVLKIVKEITVRKENQSIVKQRIDDLEYYNKQLEFFNSIILQDFNQITKALKDIIKYLSDCDLPESEEKTIRLLKFIHLSNKKLISTYNKIMSVYTINKSEFEPIDLVKILNNAISCYNNKYSELSTITLSDNFIQNTFIISGLEDELDNLFYELIFSIAMPFRTAKTALDFDIATSNDGFDEEIQIINLSLIASINRNEKITEELTEFESQIYGLGLYLVREMLKVFHGKIFIQDQSDEDCNRTKFTISFAKIND